MAEISGVSGAILARGVALEGSEWSADLDQAVVDRSNFTTAGEPLNAAGQRTGTMSMTGPVSTTSSLAARGVARGAVVLFTFRVTAALGVQVYGRVSKVSYSNNKDNGPSWTVQASQYGPAVIVGI